MLKLTCPKIFIVALLAIETSGDTVSSVGETVRCSLLKNCSEIQLRVAPESMRILVGIEFTRAKIKLASVSGTETELMLCERDAVSNPYCGVCWREAELRHNSAMCMFRRSQPHNYSIASHAQNNDQYLEDENLHNTYRQ